MRLYGGNTGDSINFCVVAVFAACVFVATVEQTYLGNPNAIMRDIINNNNYYYYHYYCDRYSANKFPAESRYNGFSVPVGKITYSDSCNLFSVVLRRYS